MGTFRSYASPCAATTVATSSDNSAGVCRTTRCFINRSGDKVMGSPTDEVKGLAKEAVGAVKRGVGKVAHRPNAL